MDQLHKQIFISLLTNAPWDVVWACFRSRVGPTTGAWLLVRFNTPSFHLFSAHFLTTLCIQSIPHLIVLHISWCYCGHTIDDLGIHLLCFPCKNEHTATHDTFQDTIVVIASKTGIHVQTKVFHFFPCYTWKRTNIVITRNNFQTLTNIVIANPTHTNLVQHNSITTAHAGTVATQDKARSYTEWTPRNDFIPLAMETYNCFHFCFDSFLTSCVHACRTCH